MKCFAHVLAASTLFFMSVAATLADPRVELIASDPSGGADGVMSADGRSIATSSRRSGTSKIWLYDRQAMHWRQLTNGSSEDSEPAFSPDGRRVVFVAQGEHRQLHIVDVADGRITELSDGMLAPEYPAWSPDGRQIVFTGGPWKQQNFHIVAAQGGAPRPVLQATGHLGACRFLAGNQRLICNTYDRAFGDIVEVDVASGAVRSVLAGGPWPYKPTASPDGRWIAYTEIGEDGDRIRLFPTAASAGAPMPLPSFKGRWPSFRGDGSELFFLHQVEEGTLLQIHDLESGGIESVPLAGVTPGPASLSRDGRLVAYCANPDRDPHLRIYGRIERKTTTLQLGSGACHPSWSPDGRRLALTLRVGARWEIAVVDADGTNLRVVTTNLRGIAQLNGPVAWSPDGIRLTFAAATRPYESDIFVVDLTSGKASNVTSDSWFDEGPSWTSDGEIVFMSTRGGNWSWGLFALRPDVHEIREIEAASAIERRFPAVERNGTRWWLETDGCLGTTFVIRRHAERTPERLTATQGAKWFDASNGRMLLVTAASRRTEYWAAEFVAPF